MDQSFQDFRKCLYEWLLWLVVINAEPVCSIPLQDTHVVGPPDRDPRSRGCPCVGYVNAVIFNQSGTRWIGSQLKIDFFR